MAVCSFGFDLRGNVTTTRPRMTPSAVALKASYLDEESRGARCGALLRERCFAWRVRKSVPCSEFARSATSSKRTCAGQTAVRYQRASSPISMRQSDALCMAVNLLDAGARCSSRG